LRLGHREVSKPDGGQRIELTDADVQRYVSTGLDALTKAQSVISTLTDNVNKRKAELDRLLEGYERVSGLAAIDGEKATDTFLRSWEVLAPATA